MEKVIKLNLELHEKENGYVEVCLTRDSENELYKLDYTRSVVLSHMFAQLSYNILAADTMNIIKRECKKLKKEIDVYNTEMLYEGDIDEEELEQIKNITLKNVLEDVKTKAVNDAFDLWQQDLMGGIANLMSDDRDANNKIPPKYLMFLTDKNIKKQQDYMKYFQDVLYHTNDIYPDSLTAYNTEGYIADLLSLVIERHIAEYAEKHKELPDEEFYKNIHQHIIKITTEALSLIIQQLKDALKESLSYNAMISNMNEAGIIDDEHSIGKFDLIDIKNLLRTYKLNKPKKKKNNKDNNNK